MNISNGVKSRLTLNLKQVHTYLAYSIDDGVSLSSSQVPLARVDGR